jgi:uncharacterized protein with HEPN domain
MNRDKATLLAIKREIDILGQLTDNITEEEFLASEKDQRAVLMTLLNIGELIKHLTPAFRKKYADIPWKAIAGLRDNVAHTYYKLSMQRIWISVQEDIPELINRFQN